MDADPIETRVAESLAAHRRRWVLTPLSGKKPILKNWTSLPVSTEDEVIAWAHKGNVGLRTGRVSGVVVVDVDNAKGGRLEEYPRTPTVRTGSGGAHLYFEAPDLPLGNSVGSLAPNVDVRADGGQVVFPGSVHPETGRVYMWEQGLSPDEVPLATFPAEWLAILTFRNGNRQHAVSPSNMGSLVPYRGTPYGLEALRRECEAVRSAPQGTRNATLNRGAFAVGQLFAGGELHSSVVEELFEAAFECGLVADDGEDAARATIRSGFEAGRKEPRRAEPRSRLKGETTRPMGRSSSPGRMAADGPFNLTDAGNALRFVFDHGDLIRYDHIAEQWLLWDATHWREDSLSHVTELAKQTVARIFAEADAEPNPKHSKAISRWAQKSEAAPRIHALLDLACSDSRIAVLRTQLNADPMTLNVRNGTLDLSTGSLRPHRREDLLTYVLPVSYDSTARCVRWEQFLGEIFVTGDRPDTELIQFVQRAIGYSLTGLTREQVLFLLFGIGANGKSTLLEVLLKLLGEVLARPIPFETLLHKQGGDSIPNDIAALCGARLAVAVEPGAGRRLNEAKVKQLTGGDTLVGRFLFHEFFSFTPNFKLWLACNHKPAIHGTDRGIWRRIRLVPFLQRFEGDRDDKGLKDKLFAELPGILRWAVEGCVRWQKEGLGEPGAVVLATENYREESDDLAPFFDERCVLTTTAEVSSAALYRAYRSWAQERGEDPMTQTALGAALGERPENLHPVRRHGGERWWRGIGLRAVTR